MDGSEQSVCGGRKAMMRSTNLHFTYLTRISEKRHKKSSEEISQVYLVKILGTFIN